MNSELNNQGSPVGVPENDGQNSETTGDVYKRQKKWFWILIIMIAILVLLLLLLGWWLVHSKKQPIAIRNDKASSSEQAVSTPTCTSGFSEYTNAALGFGFCYPNVWGTVSVADAKFAPADTGQRWVVHFSTKSMVNLGVVTADWSTEVPRDGTCVDPAVQILPAFSPFSTSWDTEGTPVMDASRGIEVLAGTYLIDENVDDALTNGTCLHGYTIINGSTYTHTSASYSAPFFGAVTTPQQHIDNPNTLISAADRTDFTVFVKSVHSL